MNKLLLLDDKGDVQVSPEALVFKEYADVYNKYPTKADSLRDLAYVIFMESNDDTNPYHTYIEEERKSRLREELLPKGWKEDKDIKAARLLYRKHNRTFNDDFLDAARVASNKLKQYYLDVDLNEKTAAGTLVNKSGDLFAAVERLNKTMDSIDMLEDRRRRDGNKGNVRGGVELGLLENPD